MLKKVLIGKPARPEHKHVLELHFSRNEFQVNVFSVFGHLPHQEPTEKVPSVYYMKVATESSRLALSLHQKKKKLIRTGGILEQSSAYLLEHLLQLFNVTVKFVAGWHEVQWG